MTLPNLDICIPGGLDVPALVLFGPVLWSTFNDVSPPPSPRAGGAAGRLAHGGRAAMRSPTINVVPVERKSATPRAVESEDAHNRKSPYGTPDPSPKPSPNVSPKPR